MRIVTLMENTPGAAGCRFEHGLSVYIETRNHRILADTGAGDGFLHNARLLDVDLAKVDLLFLSHGHYDHGGGIPAFAAVNDRAEIYMQKTAGLDYYAMEPEGAKCIGIDKSVLDLPRLHLLEGSAEVDGAVSILAGFPGRRCWSKSNLRLARRAGNVLVQDSFDHEQALVIRQGEKYLLFSGCAHNGILNVLDRFRAVYRRDPDLVISGFHFMKESAYTPEEVRDIEKTARELAGMDTEFYTGHCTGLPACGIMETIMGPRLHILHSGMEIPGL